MFGALAGLLLVSAAPLYEAEFVFDPAAEPHGHVHASCIVECPNGDLRVVWYENGPSLPPPYFSEQRDKSDDVRIGGARKPSGTAAWEAPFVMHDTFGVSDNNPCMAIDREGRLWLIHPTLLGVPENTWGSALVQYHVASEYGHAGAPAWDREGILVPHPQGFDAALVERLLSEMGADLLGEERLERLRSEAEEAMADPLRRRLGWMPRAHPLVRSDGALVVPLSNENFGIPMMAITKDAGATWTMGNPVPGVGLTQPTLAEMEDGSIIAFFRNGWPGHKVVRSESADGGISWSPPEQTDRPHTNAGLELIRLHSGRLLLVYNDNDPEGPRDRLAASLSEDGGRTWPWTRHLEDTPGGRFDYPSVVQGRDGTLHASYSFNLQTIKHVHFEEAWVEQGD